MDLGMLQATLSCDTSQMRSAESSLRQFGATADSTFNQAAGHASNFGSQLAALVGISMSVGAALAFVKTNIEAISDTSLKSIAGAAMMISRETIEGIGAQKAAYGEYRAYILDMYKELNAETQNHFASGKEMIGAFNALVQMGVYASKDEAKSIGVITDAVKLLHGGYVDQVTVMHEIRGVLEGHAGIHYKLAQQLSTIIGPEWKKIVRDQAEAGTLLTFLEEKYKGLSVASGDIQKTLTAQQTTLDTLMSQIGKAGLSGMYEDIVVWVKQINEYLREHKDELASKIASIWEGMRGSVYGVASGIGAMTRAIAEFGGQLDNISKNPAFMALFGAAAGSRAGPLGAVVGGAAGFGYAMQQRNYDEVARGLERAKREQSGLIGHGSEGEGHVTMPAVIKPPPWHPALGAEKGGKGGGGADAEINRLNSLFDTLTKDIARLSEGKLSAIEADYIKTVENIYKKTSDRAHSEAELEILAKTRATLQKTKLQDDFDLKMAKDSGDVFLEIQKQYEKDVSDFKGLVGEKEKTEANRTKKELDARMKFQETVLGMQSTSLSAMASAAPLLSQQLPIESALLDIELKRGNLKMEEELRILRINHMISAGQEDELRQLKALEDQAKKYAQARKGWMLEGVSGGLKAGALDRGKEAEIRTAQWTIDAMKGAETWLGETGGQAFVNYLHGKKTDLSQMFSDIGDSLFKQLWKMGTTKLFDSIWAGVGNALGIDTKGGKPDGSAARPFYVVSAPGAVKALSNLGNQNNPLDSGIQDLWNVFNFGGDVLSQESLDLMNVLDFGSGALDEDIMGFGQMFTASNAGLLESASSFGGIFGGFLDGISGLFGGGGGGGLGIFGGFMEGIFSLFVAKGDAFDSGRVLPYARGGVVSRPTLFPMADGLGLMGEAGPEAVLPLARTSGGDLGVRAAGGGGGVTIEQKVTIINNASDKVQANAERNSQGDLIVIIDKIVAQAYGRYGLLYKAINSGNKPIVR